MAIIYKMMETDKLKRLIFILIFSSMLLINAIYLYNNLNIFNLTKVPKEYNEVRDSMSSNERYIYLPTKLNTFHQIPTDFKFGKNSSIYYWYQNPLELWYPARNLHHPTLNMTAAELNEAAYDAYQENKQNELISLLKRAGVEKIIIDKYYYWSREAPKFDISLFLSKQDLKLERDFGQIEIYSIN